MKKGKKYFIKCSKSDYPYVRDKLTEMGFNELSPCWGDHHSGVIVFYDLDFYPYANPSAPYTHLTLEQFKQIHMKKQVIEIPDGYELKQEGNTYTIVKSEKKLPESWDELGEVDGYYVHPSGCEVFRDYTPNKSTFRTKEQAEASIALAQLTQLVHVWREGWEPNWTKQSTKKYVIDLQSESIVVDYWGCVHHTILSFDTNEKAQKFLETFEGLIKTAAPLLWGLNLK